MPEEVLAAITASARGRASYDHRKSHVTKSRCFAQRLQRTAAHCST